MDDVKSHVYYVQGMEVVFRAWLMVRYLVQEKCLLIFWSIRTCAVDNSFSKYGGPTIGVFQANLPGQISISALAK